MSNRPTPPAIRKLTGNPSKRPMPENEPEYGGVAEPRGI